MMHPEAQIIRCTVFEKAQQRQDGKTPSGCKDVNLITIDHFGWDNLQGHAVLHVSHHAPRILRRATAQDFTAEQ